MKVHFADGEPSGDAIERALRREMDGWQPRRSAAWSDFAARLEARRRWPRWRALAGAAAALAILLVVLGLALGSIHPLPAGLQQVRARLLP